MKAVGFFQYTIRPWGHVVPGCRRTTGRSPESRSVHPSSNTIYDNPHGGRTPRRLSRSKPQCCRPGFLLPKKANLPTILLLGVAASDVTDYQPPRRTKKSFRPADENEGNEMQSRPRTKASKKRRLKIKKKRRLETKLGKKAFLRVYN